MPLQAPATFVGPLPPTARGHDFLLNVTDRLTKFAVSIPCSQKISKTQLAHALFEHIYCRFGIPQVIVSDRDTRIDNEFFRILSSLQGTTHRLTTAYRPRGNGQAEAFTRSPVPAVPRPAVSNICKPSRRLGPFKIVKVPRPYVYVVDFGAKFPNANALVNADLLRPFVQPSSTPLRHAEDDFPLVGDPNRPIERLVSRARARGRPPAHGRPSFQYRVRFSDLDSHYDVWLTEKELHTKHPDVAPSLIAACDEQYPV